MAIDQTPAELAEFRRYVDHLVTAQDGIMLTDEQFWLRVWGKTVELLAAAAERRATRVSDAFTGEQPAIRLPPASDG